MDARALRFIVRGRVQGEGFRYFVVRHARRLGLSGYTRNQQDGSVEVVAIGEDGALGDLKDKLQQGPAAAQVESVEASPIAPGPRYDGLAIL